MHANETLFEFMVIIGSEHFYSEKNLFNNVVQEIDRAFLGMLIIYF